MKKTILIVVAFFVLILLPVWTFADSVEGTVQGLTCVVKGKLCPVGKEDPMAAIEKVFVVLTAGKDYYFVPNVDRTVLARHINERVRVFGIIEQKHPVIIAWKIDIFTNGAWITKWKYECCPPDPLFLKLLEISD